MACSTPRAQRRMHGGATQPAAPATTRERTPKHMSEGADLVDVMLSSRAAMLGFDMEVGRLLPAIDAGADGRRGPRQRQWDHGAEAQGDIMANDEEWVEDVKRWCLAGSRPEAAPFACASVGDEIALGYEAAAPALQAQHWPDAPTTGR